MNNYQSVIIGGGPGGYIAAIQCAKRGLKTLLIEKQNLGGTCLNRGCIPTKALLHSSHMYHEMQNCKSLGIELSSEIGFKYKKMVKRKDKIVKQLRSGIEALVSSHGADLLLGEAVLTGSHSIRVGTEEITADNIILASGSAPANIPIPGADDYRVLNSDGVLSLDTCPESVAIIGGGVIGVEFAFLFSDLGKPVTIIEMMPSILYGNDPEVCRLMHTLLEEKGVKIYTNAKVDRIRNGHTVAFTSGNTSNQVCADAVIMATGRSPQTAALHLDAAGVNMTDNGFIPIDTHCRTNVPHIYAIGDITGKMQLAHVATAHGIVAADNAAGLNAVMDDSAVPSCIYTTPEIASAGLTEEKAAASGIPVKTGTFDVSGNGRSMAVDSINGFVKLVVHEETDVILGCQIVAANATEIIGEAALAIQNGLTAGQLGRTIHAHPTVSESLMEAAHDVHGMCCHKL